ncbi:MAG: SPOR domain-containing protein [Gammaproteobacteria bacterium]|nr:SPOR domain-containing protein [Rhodocyclaceae bacterium]MBU3910173.1 SPOR domain-containing protein [Gammaproteobacteria bacterium]MBU3989182.1 SPOR domain-containing protein [Gammaproteobacteria bacterium]MBU4006180.1 SPOR domain-containing protein [Gammaproteobacteria bacterium]MBU4022635.1 SPOR domain-containing protein [Gammaproteobacteria bacterium]
MRGNMRGGTLLGVALGLVIGVLISFGVVWYLNKTPLPFVDRVAKQEPKENAAGTTGAQTPTALPGKPGDKPMERKFDFYEILEGKKSATPDGPAPAAPVAQSAPLQAPPPAAATTNQGLFLQVGAFQKAADAENLKARLAMQGFEASILEADVPEKGTMHRVRIGPYANPEEMNRARSQLSQNGIPATVVRVKE